MRYILLLTLMLCCATNFVIAQTSSAPAKDVSTTPSTHDWTVRFIAGPARLGANSIQLSVAPDALTVSGFDRKHNPLKPLIVPMRSVRSIVYSPTQFNRAERMSGAYPPVMAPGADYAGTGYLLALLVASRMKGEKHFISVQWEQDGVEQEIMLEAPKEIAGPLAAELEKVAGPVWMNLSQRSEKALAEIETQKENAFHFSLEKSAAIAQFRLAQGPYTAVLLEHAVGENALYIFAGEAVSQDQLKAIATVFVSPATNAVSLPTLQFSNASPPEIVEMQVASKRLRLH